MLRQFKAAVLLHRDEAFWRAGRLVPPDLKFKKHSTKQRASSAMLAPDFREAPGKQIRIRFSLPSLDLTGIYGHDTEHRNRSLPAGASNLSSINDEFDQRSIRQRSSAVTLKLHDEHVPV